MRSNRRAFVSKLSLSALGLLFTKKSNAQSQDIVNNDASNNKGPIFVSTWKHGVQANKEALRILKEGGSGLDAVEYGVRIIEADPDNTSVGMGGLPDRTGKVTLDACIMGPDGNCGAVCMLEDIKHPISVARMVMENTEHVMLASAGAKEFALNMGFKKENLLTKKSKKLWKEWKETAAYKPIVNVENHDTIGMLAMDANGDIFGSCTTSGLAYKKRGRIGDSPIIGAGLFIDNEVGGAVATGLGESIIKVAGAAIIVELMRHGYSPLEACKEAINRIKSKEDVSNIQVGFLAMNKGGEVGSASIHKGFNYAHTINDETTLVDSHYLSK